MATYREQTVEIALGLKAPSKAAISALTRRVLADTVVNAIPPLRIDPNMKGKRVPRERVTNPLPWDGQTTKVAARFIRLSFN